MTVEETPQKSHIHQEHAYFSMLLSVYATPHTLQQSWHHQYPGEHEG